MSVFVGQATFVLEHLDSADQLLRELAVADDGTSACPEIGVKNVRLRVCPACGAYASDPKTHLGQEKHKQRLREMQEKPDCIYRALHSTGKLR